MEGAGNRRKPQICAGNRRFSQKTAGNRRLGSVTLGASPLARPQILAIKKHNASLSAFRNQRAPNPPESAQPRLSRVKRRSSPARGYKFGCVCSYMAGHKDAEVMTGHIGTNAPKFVPPRWGRPPFDPTQTGLCKFGWVWSSLKKIATYALGCVAIIKGIVGRTHSVLGPCLQLTASPGQGA